MLYAHSHKNVSDVSSLSEHISIFMGLKFDLEEIRCCSEILERESETER